MKSKHYLEVAWTGELDESGWCCRAPSIGISITVHFEFGVSHEGLKEQARYLQLYTEPDGI